MGGLGDNTTTPIVFFDGDCGLCHRYIRFVLRNERPSGGLKFASLQGETARKLLPHELVDRVSTMVVRTEQGRLLTRSDASVFIGRRLRHPWRASAIVGGWLPRPVRDAAYRLVASARRRLFSRPASNCPVHSGPLRERFLD